MYGKCPKHPETIQHDHLGKCMVWEEVDTGIGSMQMQCERALVPLSTTELQEIQAECLQDALEKTTLPSWVVAGMQQIAYDQGHAYGQKEVDGYVLDWLTVFETLQKHPPQ